MNESSFVEYALSASLNSDETYTVELLIDRVRFKFDPGQWDEWSKRNDDRCTHDYKPSFPKEHVRAASIELGKLSWVSLQRIRDDKRPVRDLTALRCLSKLTDLVITDNEVTDLAPLGYCKNLRKLYLTKNPIRDISPLGGCVNIEELELSDTPIRDFSVLQKLPKLRRLSISAEQLAQFKQIMSLPSLQTLEFGLDAFDSFDGFPAMPELRVIRGAHVKSLNGLEKFPKLENLVNLSGEFDSLEPIRELKCLTHANILSSWICSLDPVSRLFALRELWLSTELSKLDLTPLEALPALHVVTITCAGVEPHSLAKLRADLPSWDVEFFSRDSRHIPSLEIEVVDQETFDYYDTKNRFGLTSADTNEGLLSSELEWLDEKIEAVFAVDFAEDEDYTIPFNWGGGRSRTVVLLSERALEAFSKLVLGIQNVLCHSNKDWIIYLQSDGGDFTVWVYPQKLMLTEEYEGRVRQLIKPN